MSYVDTFVEDMSLFHDGPSDVLQAYPGWGSGAYPPDSYNKPAGWTNGLMWFHMTEDAPLAGLGAADRVRPWRSPGPFTGNLSSNTRVQARDLQLWFLLPDGTWFLHGHAVTPGSYMPPITWGNEAGALSNSTWRAETTENGGGASIKEIGYGAYENAVWHAFTSPKTPLPATYLAIASCFYARLILDNPAGTDDRASAHVLAAGAGDYYESQAVADGMVAKTVGGNVNPMGYSRFKYVTNDWQLFAFYSIRTLSETALRANPPPIIGLSLLDAQGGGGGTPPPTGLEQLQGRAQGLWLAKTDGAYHRWAPFDAVPVSAKVRRRARAKY